MNGRVMIFLYLVSWTVLFPLRSPLVGAMMTPIITPSKCLGIGDVPIPTSAVVIPDDVYMAFPSKEHQAISRINCALRAAAGMGLAYLYEGNICTVYGAGEYRYGNNTFFVPSEIPPVDDLEEVAQLKQTYASIHFKGWHKDFAVDGIFGPQMYHSENGIIRPWWIVDLAETRTIHQVQIFTRQDCCSNRFHDIQIRVGNTLDSSGEMTSYTLMSTYDGPYVLGQGHVICSLFRGVTGRYLGVKKVSGDGDHLQLLEVKVYAAKKIS
ncbi:uncharacterized protein [Palaemon carinicauda]|uniref:uncharacterized protein n=1 Tax=Palaemon carinicauda TaxID=392227 RepID=UPI0035B5B208